MLVRILVLQLYWRPPFVEAGVNAAHSIQTRTSGLVVDLLVDLVAGVIGAAGKVVIP